MTGRAGRATPGILISLDALVSQRADQPAVLEEAPVALARIGWMGRPIILVGERVADRDLPASGGDREAWVRATVGPGAYAVAGFEQPVVERGPDGGHGAAVDQWREVTQARGGTWLITDQARQVGPARQAGLMVILIGPGDGQPWLGRPDYRARDLRDAVGHLLAEDVFAGPASVSRSESSQAP